VIFDNHVINKLLDVFGVLFKLFDRSKVRRCLYLKIGVDFLMVENMFDRHNWCCFLYCSNIFPSLENAVSFSHVASVIGYFFHLR
jgi:hypothetical protein